MPLTLGEGTDSDGVRRAQRHREDRRPVRTTSPQEGRPACGARPDPVEGRGGSWGWGTPIGGGGDPTAQALARVAPDPVKLSLRSPARGGGTTRRRGSIRQNGFGRPAGATG